MECEKWDTFTAYLPYTVTHRFEIATYWIKRIEIARREERAIAENSLYTEAELIQERAIARAEGFKEGKESRT